jgi:alanine racemase
MELDRRCYATLSLGAFEHNVAHARATLAGDAKLMVAVKSEAYGHGTSRLAQAALRAGADALAVLDIPQGVALREELPEIPLLCWLHSPSSDFGSAARARLDVGISGVWQLDLLAGQAPGLNTRVHLKVDTGLHRNGALAKDWPALVARAHELQEAGDIEVVGIWSHLADTSLQEDLTSLERFHDAVSIARSAGLSPELLHIAASSAAADLPEARLDMVRIGIIAYGVSPFDDRSAADLGFHPVMSVHARVMSHTPDSRQAVLGMGFGDGLLPPTRQAGWVVHQNRTFVIDALEADHTLISSPEGEELPGVGETITLWGDPNSGSPRAEDWATWAGTIGDEIVASLGHAVPRDVIA